MKLPLSVQQLSGEHNLLIDAVQIRMDYHPDRSLCNALMTMGSDGNARLGFPQIPECLL